MECKEPPPTTLIPQIQPTSSILFIFFPSSPFGSSIPAIQPSRDRMPTRISRGVPTLLPRLIDCQNNENNNQQSMITRERMKQKNKMEIKIFLNVHQATETNHHRVDQPKPIGNVCGCAGQPVTKAAAPVSRQPVVWTPFPPHRIRYWTEKK